jgi:hypothetical protein
MEFKVAQETSAKTIQLNKQQQDQIQEMQRNLLQLQK